MFRPGMGNFGGISIIKPSQSIIRKDCSAREKTIEILVLLKFWTIIIVRISKN
jgi:hypothetical protein